MIHHKKLINIISNIVDPINIIKDIDCNWIKKYLSFCSMQLQQSI